MDLKAKVLNYLKKLDTAWLELTVQPIDTVSNSLTIGLQMIL